MAFNGNFMCTSFKVEVLKGVHNFTAASNVFKLAMYTNSATFTAATTAYTSTNEISGTNYTLIFNEAASGDPTVCVLDFGGDKAASSGDFTVVMPTADASNAIIRIA